MNDQTKILNQLSVSRLLLARPSTLPPKILKAAAAVAQDLGDRCYFNAGWYAATPNQTLKGSAATTKIQDEISLLIDMLQRKSKIPRGRGRPANDQIPDADLPVIMEFLSTTNKKSLASIIDAAIFKNSSALDKTKTTAAHVKRIERVIEKIKNYSASKNAKF